MNEILEVPNGESKVLLHSCCAPCSGELIEKMLMSGINLTIFFYNPNIHPKKEYEIRKNENIRFAEKMGISFIDADYDVQNWFARSKGMEYEPERGKRCSMCFDMRLNGQLFMPMRMILKLLPVLLVFPVGKIWIKLMNQGSRLLLITME